MEEPDAAVAVFHRNGMWCCSESAQGRFLAGALDDASEKVALEAAHVKFPHVKAMNISRGPDCP